MKALTAAEMREVDRLTTERFGIPSLQLMENAGQRVVDFIDEAAAYWHTKHPHRVAILCGKGNNGGDGFVVARLLNKLKDRFEPRVYLVADPLELKGDAAGNYERWKELGGGLRAISSPEAWDKAREEVAASRIVVDAMFGTGIRGAVTGLPAKVIGDLNEISGDALFPKPALIVALDTPSGLISDGGATEGPMVRAHATVTFTAPKVGQLVSKDSACCGRVYVRSIGSPLALIEEMGQQTIRWAGPEEFARMPLVRAADSHKGSFGHAVILAGSRGKSGAAVLAGYACMTAGAGLTTVATPDEVQPVIAGAHAEYMTEPLLATKTGGIAAANSSSGRIAKLLEGKSAVAIGPGIGTHVETRMAVQQIVKETPLPVILDADGLNCFDGEADRLAKRKTEFLAVTPHPGEMARLLGIKNADVQSERVKTATEAAKKWKAHVILKGYHTVLAGPDGRVWVNTTGGPELAKGGSGDVLTGVLAAVTAQFGTVDWLRVLALGVYLHGAAADCTGGGRDPSGMLASEVAAAVPDAREGLLREIQFGG